MKKCYLFLIILSFGLQQNVIFCQTNPKHVWVKPHVRDGKYIEGHYRTAPNNSNRDNFSTRGNYNPYTLEPGYIEPDNKPLYNNTNQYYPSYNNSSIFKYESHNGTDAYDYLVNMRKKLNSTSNKYYTSGPVYLREWKTESSKIIALLPYEAELTIIEYSSNDYCKVKHNNTIGYIKRNSIISIEEENDDTNGSSNGYEIINSSYLYKTKPSYITTTDVNLRQWRSTSSAIKTVIPRNAEVKVINSFYGDWWEIYYQGQQGYLNSRYLKLKNKKEDNNDHYFYSVNPNYSGNHYILTDETSLREGASSKTRVLLRFKPGDNVDVIDSSDNWWWKVKFKDKIGWVKKALLKKI